VTRAEVQADCVGKRRVRQAWVAVAGAVGALLILGSPVVQASATTDPSSGDVLEGVLPAGEVTPGDEALVALGELLPVAAELNEMTTDELDRVLTDDNMAWLDGDAKLGYTMPIGMFDQSGTAVVPGTAAAAAAAVPLAQGPFPYADTFLLHSKPGSLRTIYLDFNGHTIFDSAWNAYFGGGAPIVMEPFSLDANGASFSSAEQDAIQVAWQRVAEDFAPFDVDVTTQPPTAGQLERTSYSDDVYGQRALFTNDTDLYGSSACGGCSGVSYVGVFNDLGEYYEPSLAFTAGVGANPKSIAEVLSHELGHALGLDHDGRSAPVSEYYAGQGSWAPIMGDSENRPISQWSIGDYANPSKTEDDFAQFAFHGAHVRPDDHVDVVAGSTPLSVSGINLSGSGMITTRSDVDMFSFSASTGPLTLSATPAPVGPNLDIKLDLLNASGTVLASADPLSGTVSSSVASGLSASISFSIPADGIYYVRVDGVGAGNPLTTGYSDYSSLGPYSITGVVATDVTAPAAPLIDAASLLPTNDPTPQIAGAGETGAQVTVATATSTLCQLTVVNSRWACSPAASLGHGATSISVTQADLAANVSPAAVATLQLDLIAPGAPTVNAATTRDNTPTLSGTGESSGMVDVLIDGNVVCNDIAVPGNGQWTCESLLIAYGIHQMNARQSDSTGNVSPASGTVELRLLDRYNPLPTPARVLDTRPATTADGQFRNLGKQAANTTFELSIAGRVGVPAAAQIAELNVTVDGAEASGYITVYPCGELLPTASSVNFVVGETVANSVFTRLGSGGKVCIFTSARAHVLVDVQGFAEVNDSFTFLAAPVRLADSRKADTVDGRFSNEGLRRAGSISTIDIAGRAGIANNATGVVLNVTVDGSATSGGFLTVFPCGTTPNTSNLNFSPGEPMAAQVIARLSATGKICVFTSAATHLIVDAAAFAPASSTLVFLSEPARLLETRSGTTVDGAHVNVGRRTAGTTYQLPIVGRAGVPANATAVALNVTAVDSEPGNYLTVFPCGSARPDASNVNAGTPGQAVSNSVVARVGDGGAVCVFAYTPSHLIVDVQAYLTS
jgi:Bacterial Ig-like domain/Bacterial pre-peptidase C-terminal domain